MSNGSKWRYFILAILTLFGVDLAYDFITDDVRISNMRYTPPPGQEHLWTVQEMTSDDRQNLARIISQRFSYIGKGTQSYAFASEDGLYVLKFFNFKRLQPNGFIEKLISFLPFPEFKQSYSEKQKRRLNSVFKGYGLAFRETRESSGLVYVHLAQTKDLHLSATLIDKIGRELKINLDDFVFIVQRKGETSRNRLRDLLKNRHLNEAKQAISKIFAMYLSDYKKGIYDRDHNVPHNVGFLGSEPFHIDSGRLEKDSRMKQVEFYKEDFLRVASRLNYWTRKYFPEYYSEISDLLSEEYRKATGDFIDFKTIRNKHHASVKN